MNNNDEGKLAAHPCGAPDACLTTLLLKGTRQ